LRNSDELILGTAEFVGEADILRRFLEKIRQEFAPALSG
jgi:hypothetical protein